MGSSEGEQKLVLCVGLVCLDIVNVVNGFPEEDTDQRVVSQRWQKGGNAANSCTVLRELGAPCHFLGTFAKSHGLGFLQADFQENGICISGCSFHDNAQCPVSVIIVNQVNGSRTILHSGMNFPELSFSEFKAAVDGKLHQYKWVHFESRPRSISEQCQMISYLDEYNNSLPESSNGRIRISVELEKTRKELLPLMDKADYVFISKDHAQMRGYDNKEEAASNLLKECRPGASLICPWGENGAVAKSHDGQTFSSPIFPPAKVVDTLAAGDTFNAATILALSNNKSLEEAITYGCKVAGAKCGMHGIKGLGEVVKAL